MTAFRKYFNLILIILGGAILFSGKSSVGAWLMLSAAGTVVFVFSGVVFLRERNFFERHLTCDELAKFQQLFPLINPLGVRIANSKYDAMEKERNERLKQISTIFSFCFALIHTLSLITNSNQPNTISNNNKICKPVLAAKSSFSF